MALQRVAQSMFQSQMLSPSLVGRGAISSSASSSESTYLFRTATKSLPVGPAEPAGGPRGRPVQSRDRR